MPSKMKTNQNGGVAVRPKIKRRLSEETKQASRERLARARALLAQKIQQNRPAYIPGGCKFCSRCGYIKFRGSFSNHRNMHDGKQTVCKDCTSFIPTSPSDPDVWMPGSPEPDPMYAESYSEPRRTKEEMSELRVQYARQKNAAAPVVNGATESVDLPDLHEFPVSLFSKLPEAHQGVDIVAEVNEMPMMAEPVQTQAVGVLSPLPEPMTWIGSNELILRSAIVHAILDGQRLQMTLIGGNTITLTGERGVAAYRWLYENADRAIGAQTESEQLRGRIVTLEERIRDRENMLASQRRDVDAAMELANEAVGRYNELVVKLGPLAEVLQAVRIDPLNAPKRSSE